jgi:hypothetical protein
MLLLQCLGPKRRLSAVRSALQMKSHQHFNFSPLTKSEQSIFAYSSNLELPLKGSGLKSKQNAAALCHKTMKTGSPSCLAITCATG